MTTTENTRFNPEIQETHNSQYSHWFSSETGIYSSKHPAINLPKTPFLDVVSFIFSYPHNGSSALIDSSSGSSIPYSKLPSLVKSMASGLHEMGVSKGDVVLILLPNGVYYPIIVMSVMYLGAIVTTMNPLSSALEIKKQVKDCNVRFAFSLSEKIDKLTELGVSGIAVPENLNSDMKKLEFTAFRKLVSCDFDRDQRSLIRQQDTAAIMYSSGTTGASKGVLLTHGNFIAMVELFVRFEASQYSALASNNVYLALLPMFHIYGLSLFVLGLLSLGSTIVVMRKFDAIEIAKAVDRYGVTHFPVVPPMLIALTKMIKTVGRNCLRSLIQVSSGAAPLRRELIEEFTQSLPHVDFVQGYGMTESTAVGTRGFNTEKFKKYSSVGLLAPNTQAKVVDWNTGSFLPPRCVGELWLHGPGVMKGYLNNAEASSSTIDQDGWLRTGDIVYFDQDGFLYISDRLKDVIKYKGFQIAPADLEAVLITHPEVVDVAVTAIMNEEVGDIPVAFVVRRNGSSLSQAAIIAFVAEQVAPYKKIRKVVFTSSIPRSPAGKILRRELRKLLSSKL